MLRHENRLALAALVACCAAIGLGLSLGPRAISLLALCLAVGLLHRRLKRIRAAKPLYVAIAWSAVVVGLPAAVDREARHVAWVAASIGLAVLANAIASNVRDGQQRHASAARALAVARGCAMLSLGLLLFAPAGLWPLAAVPLATLLALLRSRIDERWGLVAVDGALIAGAAAAIAMH